MRSRHEGPKPVRPDTHAAALRAPDSPVRDILIQLMHSAPAPLDCAGLLAFCVGAAALIAAALKLLKDPAPPIVQLHSQCQALAAACIARYEAHGDADAYQPMTGYKDSHPAWAAVVAAGEADDIDTHPAAAALGVELCLSLGKEKRMAVRFATNARLALGDDQLQDISLHEVIEFEWDGKPPSWLTHAKTALVDFRGKFERAPPEPPSPKTFEQRAANELRNRAAYASYRRRAGVLDNTCWSLNQITEGIRYGSPAPFANLAERKAAMWFVGISGLFAGTVKDIPLAAHAPAQWVAYYDPMSGLLYRDYSCLAPKAARPRPGKFVPASYCAPTPAPEDVRDFTRDRALSIGDPKSVGDLIPVLQQIQSHTTVYPWAGDLIPSWARWARTIGPFALQVGLDSLLAGFLSGDFGVTAKSKLHYCEVTHKEIAKAAKRLYEALGWGNPVPMPMGVQLSFGIAVTTPLKELARLDAEWVKSLNAMRPPNRLSDAKPLLDFHNRYVRLLAARLSLWLSLRAATALPIRACVDADFDLVIDLVEKSNKGWAGGMPAVICEAMRDGIKAYLLHCEAMRNRLRDLGWHGEVIEWLDAVINGEDVSLLCEISARRHARPIGTAQILELEGAASLAPDWGRKTGENFLRRAGARWQDLDRHQRHEVKGQEQDTQVADGTEAAWARRMAPLIDEMSKRIHKAALYGLRNPRARK